MDTHRGGPMDDSIVVESAEGCTATVPCGIGSGGWWQRRGGPCWVGSAVPLFIVESVSSPRQVLPCLSTQLDGQHGDGMHQRAFLHIWSRGGRRRERRERQGKEGKGLSDSGPQQEHAHARTHTHTHAMIKQRRRRRRRRRT